MQGTNSEVEALMLVTLQKVPHLAHVCAEMHVLKELRSICLETRPLSTGLITGLSLDFEQITNGLQMLALTSVMRTSRLHRINVVLHLESHGEQAYYHEGILEANTDT